MRHKLTAVAEQEYSAAGGAKALAEILNHADRTTERNVLEHLATADKDLAEEVRGMLFVFEDIVKLDERAIQQVLREVDQKDLVLALRGAPEDVNGGRARRTCPSAARRCSRRRWRSSSPSASATSTQAQSRIVAVVRRLEEAGTIVIASGDEEDGRSRCLTPPSATPSSSSNPPTRRRGTQPSGCSPRPQPRPSASAGRRTRRGSPRGTRRASSVARRSWPRRSPRSAPPPPRSSRCGARRVEGVERDAIELALALAGKILAGALQARPELVVEVVRGALRRVGDAAGSPCSSTRATSRLVRGAIDELTAQGSGVELCDLQADERVAAGGASCARRRARWTQACGTQLERAREVACDRARDRGAIRVSP